MENQHRHIKGYRELSPVEIAAINDIKTVAASVENLIAALQTIYVDRPDQRWVAIGQTHLQQGFMALTRAVAKPTTF